MIPSVNGNLPMRKKAKKAKDHMAVSSCNIDTPTLWCSGVEQSRSHSMNGYNLFQWKENFQLTDTPRSLLPSKGLVDLLFMVMLVQQCQHPAAKQPGVVQVPVTKYPLLPKAI